MSDELKGRLLARQKELTEKICHLQIALSEINSLLKVTTNGRAHAVPAVSYQGTVTDNIRQLLSGAGDVGLTVAEVAHGVRNAIGYSRDISSRLSVLKARSEVNHVGKRYVLKPHLRNAAIARAEPAASEGSAL